MTTFVSQNPETGTEETLDKSVHGPQESADGGRGNVFGRHIVVEDVEGDGQRGKISGNISQSSSRRTLKTVCGNCIADLVDGIVWNLELVAIGIEHLPTTLLDIHCLDFGQGR